MDNEALISAIAGLIAVVVYLYLGWRLSRRRVSHETRLPAAQFVLFWLALALVSGIGALESLTAAFQVPSLALVVTFLYVEILLLCVLLWALVSYLVYLFTGRGYTVPISLLYGTLYVLLVYFITLSEPTNVTVTFGVVSTGFANQVSGPILSLLLLVLLAPEFVGAILYLTLYFRTRDPTVRYRVTLVSLSLIAWFGLGFVNVG
ncbi:MAG TPA: hypothetical protein VIZ68_04665, partial [Thermoplasmata archaeon]